MGQGEFTAACATIAASTGRLRKIGIANRRKSDIVETNPSFDVPAAQVLQRLALIP
jgi:hypothetical protein